MLASPCGIKIIGLHEDTPTCIVLMDLISTLIN